MTTSTEPSTARRDEEYHITILRGLVSALLAIAVATTVVLFVQVFTSKTLGAPLELDLDPASINADYPTGASIAEATAYVEVEASLGLRLLWWLVTDALALPAIAFLEILRRMLAKGAEPFTEVNERRLRWLIGLSFAFGAVNILRPIVSIAIQETAGFDGFYVSFGYAPLVVALLLSALLEVWRHGVAMRTEQELTI